MDETQIRKILNKAKELNVIINKELVTKALEIKELATSAENKRLLERLISSLEQYIAKEQNLVYVGLVGHYSSGKSSTINSILQIKGGSDERDTALHPTDTTITLITDKANSQKIMHMTKESVYVPVRTVTIDSAFLKDLVIADTPGSGDPNIDNELIQDFLPICDYIFYFISAANPIDQADIPLLLQKNKRLPFIPLYFVITRTDEFKITSNQPLSDENTDSSKRNGFMGQLMSRLKEFSGAAELSEKDFVFIDNREGYNIEELRVKILGWSTELGQSSLWDNHSHKLEFYSRNLEDLESFFLNNIKEKIKITGDFLRTAGENINKFDAAVDVNNEKLRNVWVEGERKLKLTLQTEYDQLNSMMAKTIPRILSNTEEMATEKRAIATFIENQSNGNIGRFTAELYSLAKAKILTIKQDIGNVLESDETDIDKEDIREVLPSRIDFFDIDDTLEIDFSKMDSSVISYLNRLYLLADEERSKLMGRLDQFKAAMDRQQVINALEDVYKQGADNITENFDKYFDVIEMYKASVLTKNTKDTIQKLRIGKQLDELDDEFPEHYKQEKKEGAILSIYPRKDQKILDLKKDLTEVEDNILQLKRELGSDTIRRNSTVNIFFQKEEFRIVDIMEEARLAIEMEINRLYQEKLLIAFEDHRSSFQEFREQQQKQKKTRQKAIFKWTGIAAISGILIYLLMVKLNMVTPTAVRWTIGFGVISSTVFALIGNLITRLRTDLNKMTERHHKKFKQKAKEQLRLTFNEDFFNTLSASLADARPKKRISLERIYEEKLTPVTSQANSDIMQVLDGLASKNALFVEQQRKYLSLVSQFQSLFLGIFSNPDENVKKIRVITQQVKEKSIEPSFTLLKNTKNDLEQVKDQIENIERELEPI
ncbi:50S ribosome-binding GTPase [Chryseobacterium tructae]|uniref:GTPase n=1 Tax=Chryseobacterium tructae TaxID=1037380 RepID=A0ABV7XW90_9FLAO|nr:GTPase [Chryseobacterium tructae]MDN3692871.1 50S ribosome-binding GTPase [Chryseobacterium tructae]